VSDEQTIYARVEVFVPTGVGWFSVTSDVVSNIKVEWGIHGGTPKDRVASPGTMTFDLDNSSNNAGGVRGYYSPGHPEALFVALGEGGWGLGMPVRLILGHLLYGEKIKWVGSIESIRPAPGARRPVTTVTCVDWMEEAARAKLSGLAVQTDVQSDILFTTLVAASEVQPPGGTRVGTGSDVYPFALDNTKDESTRLVAELQKLAQSEFGYVFVTAGTLVFEGRRARSGSGKVRVEFDEDTNITALGVTHERDDVLNRVQVSVHPRRRDAAATTVLFNLASAARIERVTSMTVKASYRDPNNQAERVGGMDMVTPVATTDYLFNTLADGTGADITSQLSLVVTFGGNSAVVAVTNNGPEDGYLTLLQLRGRGLYDFEPVMVDSSDALSMETYGENAFGYDMPHQSSVANAADLSNFILALNKDPATRVTSVSFIANWDLEMVERAFNVEISDRVSVTSPTVGLDNQPYYINGVRMDVHLTGLTKVTWDLAPVDTTQFWTLEVTGKTELDLTTVLGYGLFVVGWVMDTSELGLSTFLN
jgi:hypothetical protein